MCLFATVVVCFEKLLSNWHNVSVCNSSCLFLSGFVCLAQLLSVCNSSYLSVIVLVCLAQFLSVCHSSCIPSSVLASSFGQMFFLGFADAEHHSLVSSYNG